MSFRICASLENSFRNVSSRLSMSKSSVSNVEAEKQGGFTTVQSRRARVKNKKESQDPLASTMPSPYLSAVKSTKRLSEPLASSPVRSKSPPPANLDPEILKYVEENDLPEHPFVSDELGYHFYNPTSDPLVYIARYKTEKCHKRPCSRLCEKFHTSKERRRSPFDFFYSEQPCQLVKTGSSCKSWGDPSKCPDGDGCAFSHSLLEQMYHPNIYKTGMCNKFGQKGPGCSWGPLCTHAHGNGDKERQIKAQEMFRWLKEQKSVNGLECDFDALVRWIVLDKPPGSSSSFRPISPSIESIEDSPTRVSQRSIDDDVYGNLSELLESSVPLEAANVVTRTRSPSPASMRSKSSEKNSKTPPVAISRPTFANLSRTLPISAEMKKKINRSMSSSAAITDVGSLFQFRSFEPKETRSPSVDSGSSPWSPIVEDSFDWLNGGGHWQPPSMKTDLDTPVWKTSVGQEVYEWKSKAEALSLRLLCKKCRENERVAICSPCGHQLCPKCAHETQQMDVCAACKFSKRALILIHE